MFNSSFNNTFPIFYDENSDDINLFSYYDHLQSPLNYYDIESYNDFLTNHGLIMTTTTTTQEPFQGTNSLVATEDSSILLKETSNKIESNKGDEVINEDEMVIIKPCKRKRTCNKDRHSKIRTAHGLRDRRMRLSVEVARPFFKLQDMLGYDKASKTVEWLLTHSKTAIDELYLSKNGSISGVTKCTTIPSTSDCEGESIDVEQNKGDTNTYTNNNNDTNNIVVKDGVKKKKKKRMRKTTKEGMKQAREKARKRTLEKLPSREIYDHPNSLVINNHGNWSTLPNFIYQQNGQICESGPSLR